ncbi:MULTISPECIES: hypothetical protein [Winogradskyella]|uniref:Uncharacterized protein n=1 Tax=Winogradskyella marincola TaxID=3037795 RepID=A0ABT6FZB5_9FLAO|nr:hypothetical protein [Winogradskyella sp. YYF002]MDG4715133.1 hypothetical protein [Winogradskyella sp. YYF002]
MKTKSNLPEPTFNENLLFSNLKNTLRVISGVLKLTKKIFML